MYCFILGHNPTLSSIEIAKVLSGDFNLIELSPEVMIADWHKKINAKELQNQLGGTIKIGEIISEIDLGINEAVVAKISDELIKIGASSKKVFFGFSLYLLDKKINPELINGQLKKLAMQVKKELQTKKIPARWVSSRERVLSSVIVQKNKLLTQGAEFCFLVGSQKIYLARTLSCQEFAEYGFYDFGRPARSMKQGMLPPKLAKMMINLTQAKKDDFILDPFCGAGTVLQEAIKMGYHNLIGSDIDDQAIERTNKNIKWLVEQLNLKIDKGTVNVFASDVRTLAKTLSANSVAAIVTEPYLGPIDKARIGHEISKVIVELSHLYLLAFKQFDKILKKDGCIVMIFPAYKIGGHLHFLPILEALKEQGWRIINPVPEKFKNNQAIRLSDRQSIIYSRQDQHVLREIFVFKK
ncbi:MAG: DNA methyltransferase [Patescibacteria group bacterium]|nr:DNA methyltransferase [Patescibacteria group bacterium]MDD5121251.1 DNA methyltransferase [Patescibacteria group bacterium]MDD5395830.1 DNA methyltransferase [Patescibacteria group bacterium]